MAAEGEVGLLTTPHFGIGGTKGLRGIMQQAFDAQSRHVGIPARRTNVLKRRHKSRAELRKLLERLG